MILRIIPLTGDENSSTPLVMRFVEIGLNSPEYTVATDLFDVSLDGPVGLPVDQAQPWEIVPAVSVPLDENS